MVMKILIAIFLAIFVHISVGAQTYVYTIDDYGVDSFFLNESYIVTEGATSVSTIENRYFFSDTAQLTQFIQEMQTRQENQYDEGTRLRNEALALQVRIDSIESKRLFAGLSIQPFQTVIPTEKKPEPKKEKPPADKPKNKSKATKKPPKAKH